MQIMKHIVFVTLGILALALLSGWLFLALPLFSDMRRGLAENVLSSRIGQPVEVRGDVRAVIGRNVSVSVSGLTIPSETMAEVELAALDSADFKLETAALFTGKIRADEVVVDGMRANLLIAEDGTKSWSGSLAELTKADNGVEPEERSSANERRTAAEIVELLNGRSIHIGALELHVSDAPSAFEFDFSLKNLDVEAIGEGGAQIDTAGTVNDVNFNLAASFPGDGSGSISADLGDTTFHYAGPEAAAGSEPVGAGQLSVAVGSLAQVLQAAGLDLSYDGVASFDTAVAFEGGQVAFEDVQSNVTFANGRELAISGRLSRPFLGKDFDLRVAATLNPGSARPEAAERIKDLSISALDARVTGDLENFAVTELIMETNTWNHGLDEIGPVSVGSIKRTEDGKLSIQNIAAEVSVGDVPIVSATGSIGDALNLREYAFTGVVSVPASLVVGGFDGLGRDIGRFDANVAVSDGNGQVRVERFAANVTGTDVWSLAASGTWPDVTRLEGAGLSVALEIPSPEAFLAAMNAGAAAADPLRLTLEFGADASAADIDADLVSGGTLLGLDLELSAQDDVPRARGSLNSQELILSDVENLRNFIVAMKELADDKEIEDGREVQQLVLDDDRSVQPLVQPKDGIAAIREMLQPSTLLRNADVEFSINIEKIVGPKGVTELDSTLIAKDGQFRFGPLNFQYGGGLVTINADADLGSDSNLLRVSGTARGWDLGDVLAVADIDMDARGTISADFDLAGPFSSPKAFAGAASGGVTIRVDDGAIASSLLELAGLGIMPWLFSNERRQGYTRLVCANAPIRIDRGKISTEGSVVETERVQFVLHGDIDVAGNSLNIHGRPRPVGEPLSRSAWPFNVTGPLNDPKFDLLIGGNRQRRADGADVMPLNRVPCRPDILQLQ
ncbi:AsmA family protein [Ovoidimarina sediminis]|uniref:AsmA-like C-terminal region-containing protein n=1 Tax=Ovoidimarina sediminis TaxID=3079856 RepID=UPI00291539DC|nr:AsmA-like C-terminal region-containing protein [Rhodophyticola sp. MJ-SS7]MDU8944264.1 AsmA-like C-terminal region-containing protein [Rhodophyticola sp. MJ-SS7]